MDRRGSWQGPPLQPVVDEREQVRHRTASPVLHSGIAVVTVTILMRTSVVEHPSLKKLATKYLKLSLPLQSVLRSCRFLSPRPQWPWLYSYQCWSSFQMRSVRLWAMSYSSLWMPARSMKTPERRLQTNLSSKIAGRFKHDVLQQYMI